MIVYGAGLSDGNRHLHEDLPTLIAGRAGGKFSRPGGALCTGARRRCANLFLTMMDRMGVPVDHFGDSNGALEGLDLT